MTPEEVLKQIFGYDSFRPGQKKLIDGMLAGRDVLAVMPTGAGKSLCYQVPALLLPGITLVVSPLISLMQDQVQALNAAGVHAAYINSSLSEQQVGTALRLAAQGRYKLIYAAPERLNTERFLAFAANAEISMVTVDEAHCISQWGQDFRPSYLEIPAFVRRLPGRPVLGAFTATATREVREDIACVLGLASPLVQVSGFDRPNLSFQVETPKRKMDYVLAYVREHAGESGIIYCSTRRNTEEVFEQLFRAGVSAAKYHAGMEAEARRRSQEDFVYDRAAVMVATNAFGMGIDKSNVRYVLHYNMPLCMENYYQEAGRAGRDGLPADCTLLFSPRDVMTARYLLENKDFSEVDPEDAETIRERDHRRLARMESYAGTTECLRKNILRYFGETPEGDCGNCGNCRKEFREQDRTEEAKKILNCVAEAGGRYGMQIITGTLSGAKRARISEVGADRWKSYGALEALGEAAVKELTAELVRQEYLQLTADRYPVLRFGARAAELKNPEAQVMVREAKKKAAPPAAGKATVRGKDALTSAGYRLFERLRTLRREIAAEEGIPPYIVFGDKTLIDMCVRLPKTKAEMLSVSGVGSRKLEKYGARFLEIIKEEVQSNGI